MSAKRAQLAAVLEEVMEAGARVQRDRKIGQKTFLDAFSQDAPKTAAALPDMEEWPESKLLSFEKDMLGFYLTSHPLARDRQFKTVSRAGDAIHAPKPKDGGVS